MDFKQNKEFFRRAISPYKLGIIQTLDKSYPQCKANNYSSYDRFFEISYSSSRFLDLHLA